MTSSIAQKYFNEAEKFKDNRVYEKAVESYKKAIKADPFFVSAHYNLAVSYIHIKQLDNAVACFHRVFCVYFPSVLYVLWSILIYKSCAYLALSRIVGKRILATARHPPSSQPSPREWCGCRRWRQRGFPLA